MAPRIRYLGSLAKLKKTWREATLRDTVSKWFKDMYKCKKWRWYGNNSDNQGKHYKKLLVKDLQHLWILTFLNILYVLMDLNKIWF